MLVVIWVQNLLNQVIVLLRGFFFQEIASKRMLLLTTFNSYLSIVAMLLPTNDGFVGLNSYKISSQPGVTTLYLNGYDAGTEANNELVNPMVDDENIPGAPSGNIGTGGTGVDSPAENNVVHIHPGNIGDSDPSGGESDLDSRFHRWLNPVAKVVIAK